MTIDKKKLPSRHVSVGPERAPHRSYYYAMGLQESDIEKPFVGVVSTWNEAAPCNIALMRQAQSVKKGVSESDGTPREFCTITVTDGIAMGHQGMKSSLVSREVIADSTELTVRGHCYDALVGLAGCDKSLPGLMMAMCRLNVPSVFMYGGSILPGKYKGKEFPLGEAENHRIVNELGYVIGTLFVLAKFILVLIIHILFLFKIKQKAKFGPMLALVSVQLFIGPITFSVSFISFLFWFCFGLFFVSLNNHHKSEKNNL